MSSEPYQVLYLTGAPATGKSTLVASLERVITPLRVFSYNTLLRDHVADRDRQTVTHADLRRESDRTVTPEDVAVVDQRLLDTVARERLSSHVVIDTHAVTKKDYGFRVTPFSLGQVRRLNPTVIVVLYAESQVILDRIRADGGGRPTVSVFDATFHNDLQASVALIYGIEVGVPVYFLDSSRPQEALVDAVAGLVRKHA